MRLPFVLLSLWVATGLRGQEPATPGTLAALREELAAARAELAALRDWSPAPTVVHGSLGVDVTTHYYFRGIPQEDRGVIVQPSVELAFDLARGGEFVHDVALVLGTWNSLHDGPTGEPQAWYESDVYAGLNAGAGERLTFGARYTAYHSPNGRFATVQEVSGSLTLDDEGLLLPFALRPSVTFAFELDGQADAGSQRGIVAELGLDPAFPLATLGANELAVAVPVRVGCSVGGYYEAPTGVDESKLGYADVGLVLSLSAPNLPSLANGWTFELGVHWLALGRTNEERNGGVADELVGTFGVSTTF